jgi:uncharacterized protein YdeI (YjbR/CyaY-like superfamily)
MESVKTIYAKNRKEWRYWLQKNHHSQKGIWLVYYKKHTGQTSISYTDAVEEAICFGWIDGQIKKIDDDKYMQRYTPRKPKSLWSEVNIERAKKMINLGYMAEFGLKALHEGMKTNERIPSSKNFSVPPYLKTALIKNKKAWNNFQNFSPSAQLAYVYWVNTAKTEETRQKRIKKTIEQLAMNKKFGEV